MGTFNYKVAVLGCGNLGFSITQGLLRNINASQIVVTRRNIDLLKPLEQKGVKVTTDNIVAVNESKVILLALKPFKIPEVLEQIKPYLTNEHILVSLATGVPLKTLKEKTGNFTNIYRAMPNVAASVSQSATCICSDKTPAATLEIVKQVFDSVGTTLVINEELMESATVLGACGTAFVLRFIRAMVQAGIQIGFSSQMATQIANQTVKGAAEILLESGNHPEAEIDKVTTPKGITITGLNEMEHQGFSAALIRGMLTAYQKIEDNKK